MLFINAIVIIASFFLTTTAIVVSYIQKKTYNEKTMVYKKKPLKELMFPPILPIHKSPPMTVKYQDNYSKIMPVIQI